MYCVKGFVSGRVQGVGFRYFVRRHANTQQLSGYAKNLTDGRVEFLLQGDKIAVQLVLELIHRGPSYANVTDVEVKEIQTREIDKRFLTL
ncbi:MAG: acylphosphatase [Gammaproteobacteria bacterium]